MIAKSWLSGCWQWQMGGCVAIVGVLCVGVNDCVKAQIVPDNTLGAEGSVITPNVIINGIPSDQIDGGATREANLFHSFSQFNVDAGRGAYFTPPPEIVNILTRVTGANRSDILGRLGVLGDANLFLINPNGIVFGKDASLDVQGSFLATTADGVKLGDTGLFSASQPATSNLLSVSPSALWFNAVAAQAIVNRSQAPSLIDQPNSAGLSPGLQVPDGQTLVLVGGDVLLEGGNLTAAQGRIELGSVAGVGEVSLSQTGNSIVLGYGSIDVFGTISLSNGAFVDASGEGGGDVQIRGARLEMTQGSDIWVNTLGAGDAGELNINATERIDVSGSDPEGNSSNIRAQVNSGATGAGGNLTLETAQLSVSQGGQIAVSTFGTGDAGELNVNATEIELIGTNPINGNPSGLFANVAANATGNGGDVTIQTQGLRIIDGAALSASTFAEGDAGELNVNATERIEVSGSDPEGDSSNIAAQVNSGATGAGGNLTLETAQLSVSQGGQIAVSTFGTGDAGELKVNATEIELIGTNPINGNPSGLFADVDANATGNGGDVTIQTQGLRIIDGANLSASTLAEGDAGELNVNATERIEVSGSDPEGDSSNIRAQVNSGATGAGGNLTLETAQLSVSQGGQISVSTFGTGDAGELKVNATERIEVSGSDPEGDSSNIRAQVNSGATGAGGNLTLETAQLSVSQGGQIAVSTFGTGDAGELNVNATEIELMGTNPINGNPSGLFANVAANATGNGGDVTIQTQGLRIIDGAALSASTFAEGDAGELNVNATERIEVSGSDPEGDSSNIAAQVNSGATGAGGNLTLETAQLSVSQGGQIAVSTFGTGDAGELKVNATEIELIGTNPINGNPSGLFADVDANATGNGGDVTIQTQGLRIIDGANLSASTLAEGDAGELNVNATERIEVSGSDPEGDSSNIRAQVNSGATGAGGNLTLETAQLSVSQGGQISVSTFGTGDAGELKVNATERIEVSGSDPEGDSSNIRAQVNSGATGAGGNLTLETAQLSVSQGGQIAVSTFGTGDAGELKVNATEIELIGTNPINGNPSGLFADVDANATGNGGDVTIQTQGLRIIDGANLSASTFAEGDAGELNVNATERIEVSGSDPEGDSSNIRAQVNSGATGAGGNLTLETAQLSVSQGGQISVSTFGTGDAGELNVNATEIELIGTNPINGNPSGLFAKVSSNATGNGGDVTIQTQGLRIIDGANLSASTLAEGDAGELKVNATEIELIGTNPINGNPSGVFADVDANATGNGGDVTIQTQGLRIIDGAALSASTFAEGDAGELNVNATERIDVSGSDPEGDSSNIRAQVNSGATGAGGNLTLETAQLSVSQGGQIAVSTFGTGDAGELNVNATEIELIGTNPINGNPSGLFANVDANATGNGGDVTIQTQGLRIIDGAALSASTFAEGDAGELNVNATERIEVSGSDPEGDSSNIAAQVNSGATGAGGNLTLETAQLSVSQGGQISVSTFGTGDAGELKVNATEIELIGTNPINGNPSGLFANVDANAMGNGGNVTIDTHRLLLRDGAFISSASRGDGTAGDIKITVRDTLEANNGTIATSTTRSAGGIVKITAGDIRLFGDSDIISNVASGGDNGGNITLTANSILAFGDSDILAFARDGGGGDVTLNTPAFFGENYRPAPRNTDPDTLENNNQVDINATGAASGVITITSDTSFIQNSLTELPDNQINTDSLLANSCIVRRNQPTRGSFFITGTGGLPQRPGDAQMSSYPTVDIETLPSDSIPTNSNPNRPWQKGDPIVEPQGVYRLPNGNLVLSRECPQ
jgi:filamentous hemagglutinin family protein